ncbi:coil containing protein [Vibrio phage 1.170.O._10N.261.52.C3]|nr:coil containing protein [Vibrio phage 1.170.O._10N.261.52.C3]
MGFSKKADVNQNKTLPEEGEQERVFVREDSDNKLFPDIQVKDISGLITDDCVGVFDYDTPIFQACANMENNYITVVCEKEGINEEMATRTAFKGRTKKISENSWLGMLNMERDLAGKEPLEVEDFVITDGKRLKMEHDKALEQAKVQIYMNLKKVRQQYGISKIKIVLGEGDNFRNELDLVRPYKDRKESARPLLLKELREWAKTELDCEVASRRLDGQMVEADDVTEFYGNIGYMNYRKTGKFNYIVIASDKDAMNNPKLLVNPDCHSGEHNPLRGKFKFPQAMLIEASDRSSGDIGMVTKSSGVDFKFYGFKGLMWQSFLSGDGADNYNALSHLPHKLGFGDKAAYKALYDCKTAKESLQKSIDVFAELLPKGVQYTSHKGEDLYVDTMTYMNTYFLCAYMMRSYEDSMDFYKLCDKMKVDTSKIVDNHIDKPKPLASESSIRDTYKKVCEMMHQISEDVSDLKGKKSDLEDRLKKAKFDLEDVWIELGNGLFLDEEMPPKQKGRDLKDFVLEYSKEKGYAEEEPWLMETLRECLVSKEIATETVSESRWYDVRETLCKVVIDEEDRFFKIPSYYTKGDIDNSDLEDFKVGDVEEVFPVKKEVIVYE